MTQSFAVSNFRLNRGNLRFLPHLIEAGQAFDIHPAIIATIVTAEAVTRPWDGDVSWDERSQNDRGEAAGLAQFTRSSWLAHAHRIGSVINRHAVDMGMAGQDGTIIDETSLLEARFDTRLSLFATAEMARRNWAYLDGRGLALHARGIGEVAKMLYLAHHEGAEGAFRYLIGARPSVSRARLESNLPPRLWPTDDLARSARSAYYAWLEDYIDRRIDVRRYLADSAAVTVPRLARLGRLKPLKLVRLRLRGLMSKIRLMAVSRLS